MKPPKAVFVCQECGAQSPKWMGRCNECGAWNSLVEERVADAAPAAAGASRYAQFSATSSAKLYAEVETAQGVRLSTGIDEFDRVLGGGVVPGSLVLLGGEPGIGKSTLLLQAAAHFAREIGPVLYASGEESEHQIKSRGDRLGVGAAPLYLLSETCIERILEEVARLKPALVIVDSVQTVWSSKFQSAPGSIGQVREAATQFLFAAKGQNIPTDSRRPRDEGRQPCRAQGARARRGHGAVLRRRAPSRASRRPRGEEPVRRSERAGCVRDDGHRARAVPNPSKLFLSERASGTPGSAVLCCVEGSRPDPRRGSGAGQHQLIRQRAADGDRDRPEPAVAVTRCAREARRLEPRRRRRLREHRRRDDHRRAGGRLERAGCRGVERAQPRPVAVDRGIRRGRV